MVLRYTIYLLIYFCSPNFGSVSVRSSNDVTGVRKAHHTFSLSVDQYCLASF